MAERARWTDEQLVAAVQASTSWRSVACALGLARGSTHRVKRRAQELNLDTSRMIGNRRWNPVDLESAVTSAVSWGDVLSHLGTVPANLGRVRGASRRAGIATEHLDRPLRGTTRSAATPELARLSIAAESFAAAWFVMTGSTVSVPSGQARFDLLTSDCNGHRRTQVKSTTHRDRDGRWVVVVARRPYGLESKGRREPYDHDDVDDFFIINGVGECYLIPVSAIAGRISLVLDHYPQFRLGAVRDLFGAAMPRSLEGGPAAVEPASAD